MTKLGAFLNVTGVALVGATILAAYLGKSPAIIITIFVVANLALRAGSLLYYSPTPAVKHGPLVWGTVIRQYTGVHSITISQLAVQYTTLDGEQIISKINVKGLSVDERGKSLPIRYDPKNPEQFMIDRESESILLKKGPRPADIEPPKMSAMEKVGILLFVVALALGFAFSEWREFFSALMPFHVQMKLFFVLFALGFGLVVLSRRSG